MIYNYIYIYFFGENPSDSTFAWQKHHFSPWKFPLSHYSSSFVHSKTMSFPGFTRFLAFFRGPPGFPVPQKKGDLRCRAGVGFITARGGVVKSGVYG